MIEDQQSGQARQGRISQSFSCKWLKLIAWPQIKMYYAVWKCPKFRKIEQLVAI